MSKRASRHRHGQHPRPALRDHLFGKPHRAHLCAHPSCRNWMRILRANWRPIRTAA